MITANPAIPPTITGPKNFFENNPALQDPKFNQNIAVSFHEGAVYDVQASEAAGHAVFRTEDFIRIMVAGELDYIDRSMLPVDHARFKRQYEDWKKTRNEQRYDGTPLRHVKWLQEGQIVQLEVEHVYTVEQLSALSDDKLRMGYRELRQKAQDFLSTQKDTAATEKLRVELQKRDQEMAELKEALKAQQAQIATMQQAATATVQHKR